MRERERSASCHVLVHAKATLESSPKGIHRIGPLALTHVCSLADGCVRVSLLTRSCFPSISNLFAHDWVLILCQVRPRFRSQYPCAPGVGGKPTPPTPNCGSQGTHQRAATEQGCECGALRVGFPVFAAVAGSGGGVTPSELFWGPKLLYRNTVLVLPSLHLTEQCGEREAHCVR